MTTATNTNEIGNALDAGHVVRATVQTVDGFRRDGEVESVYSDGTVAFVDDERGTLAYVAARDIDEWEVAS